MDEHAAKLNPADEGATIAAPGLEVSVDRQSALASLRYFDGGGDFAAMVRDVTGIGLPGVGEAVAVPGIANCVLAWRSPTETVLIADRGDVIEKFIARAAPVSDGCVIDQTGGIVMLRLRGERVRGLLRAIGGNASMPGQGEARGSRIAELPVLAVGLRAQEIVLLVERPYAAHLLGWLRACAG
jgi:hypothetical protein